MKRLFATLRFDDNRADEIVETTFDGEWRDAFDHLVNVHCRENDRELTPLRIELAPGLVDAVYDFDSAEMVYED